MSYFIRNGNTFRVADHASIDIQNILPVGNYTIKQDPFGNLFLEQIDSFKSMGKIYGDTVRNAERIMSTFFGREGKSTGVMLTGEKGSGKTLLAKTLSMECAKQGIPTIIINSPWKGDVFNKLIQDIEQPCIVLFDEFEKVYDKEDQESMLTLLDGVYPSQKLFILTCNDKWRVDSNMRNRPGRIYYMLHFAGLDVDFIREYCADCLKPELQQHTDSVCNIAGLFSEFNFDMLKALIEEMNRYDEAPKDAIKMLNANPESDGGGVYNSRLWVKGVERKINYPVPFEGNPLSEEGIHINYRVLKNDQAGTASPSRHRLSYAGESIVQDDADSIEPREDANFEQGDLVKVDPIKGSFEFVNPAGDRLIMERAMIRTFNYAAF